ncbi:MAG: hypothetical protein KKA79_08885, partial [Nanoarchaeota archaeon]|nr:hypothetical protein [Nanoarchaeota archaeon]
GKIKNLLVIGAAAIALYTFGTANAEETAPYMETASITEPAPEEFQIIKKFYELENQKEAIEQELKETIEDIKEHKIPISYFQAYGTDLEVEDYTKITETAQEHKLKGNNYQKFVRLERVLEEEDFLNEVADHYDVDKQEMIRTWNQESAFDIAARGPHGERGLAQFRDYVAKLLFNQTSKPGNELSFDWENLYPEYDTKKFDFEDLSKDYKLNVIMSAAQAKVTPDIFHNNLKKSRLTENQLYKIVQNKGSKTKFNKLRAAIKNPDGWRIKGDLKKTIKQYKITPKRIREVNNIYKKKGPVVKTALKYIIHNGGGGAVKNIRTDSFISELLLYHLAIYVKNLDSLYDLMNYHYDGLENLVKAHDNEIKELKTGESIDLWGHETKKVDLTNMKKYYDHGLITTVDPTVFGKGEITVIDGNTIDDQLNLTALDENTAKMLGTTIDIEQLYEKLIMFNQLKDKQQSLNKAWTAKDNKAMNLRGSAVTIQERAINKKFNMDRQHTGMAGINKDIKTIANEITGAGFVLNLEKYQKMKNTQ